MDCVELMEWAAFNETEPCLGPFRADLRQAVQSALIANIHRDRKTRPRPFQVNDFMLDFRPKVRQTAAEQIKIVETALRAVGVDPEKARKVN